MQEQLINVKSYNRTIFEKLYKVDRQLTELKLKTDNLITESKERIKSLVAVSHTIIYANHSLTMMVGNKGATSSSGKTDTVCGRDPRKNHEFAKFKKRKIY